MEKIHSIMAGAGRIFRIMFDLLFALGVLYLVLHQYQLFNFEELDIWDITGLLCTAMPVIFIIRFFESCKIDLERKVLVRRNRIGKRTEIPFDRLTGYNVSENWGLAVNSDLTNKATSVNKQPGYDELLDWLKAEKPLQEIDRFSFKWRDYLWLVLVILLLVSGLVFSRPVSDFVRYKFPFRAVETVELSGVCIFTSYYPQSRNTGKYGSVSIHLKEYPGFKFNASAYLPDEISLKEPRSLIDSTVFLSVNKADFELLHRHPLARCLKETVRTYEVRTGNEVVVKKDMRLVK